MGRRQPRHFVFGKVRLVRPATLLVLALACAAGLPFAEAEAQGPVFVLKWGSFGAGDGQFDYPYGVASDEVGDVYVVENGGNPRVQKFTSSGAYLAQWSGFDNGFNFPSGVAAHGGFVYVADSGHSRVQKFTDAGAYVTQWGTPGSGDGEFNFPYGVAIDAAGDVYVSDGFNHRIQKFSASGAYLSQWGSPGSGPGQLDAPEQMTIDAAGDLYVVDYNNHRIEKFDTSGNFITQWGSEGTGPSQFFAPAGIATDGAGDVYVADNATSRIQKFTSGGIYLLEWGTRGFGDGQFQGAAGIAIHGGLLYAADYNNHRMQEFGGLPTSTRTTSWGRVKALFR